MGVESVAEEGADERSEAANYTRDARDPLTRIAHVTKAITKIAIDRAARPVGWRVE
jgi:hypothetical protein